MKVTCLLCVLPSLVIAETKELPDPDEAAYPAIERFVEVLESVRKNHPDVDRLAYDRMVNHALEGMLASLDPHSSFMHPEMATQMREHTEMNPEVASLGLALAVRDDGVYIANVAPSGPAAAAGILPGSFLLEVDGKKTEGSALPVLLGSMRVAAGEVTKLFIKSPAAPQPFALSLTHRLIEERSVVESKLWDKSKGVGYLRLASFGSNCAREVEAALDGLEDGGMKSLILDLRENGGGSLNETVKILGLFLPPDTAVVTTRGRDGEAAVPMKTPDRQRRKRDYPMVVIIDRMSASASELAAGALQDLKRATIIGEVSYGKGSVQNIIPMGGGTALRLTIATYHTPSGNSPHRKGIAPDVAVAIDDSARANFQKRCRVDALSPQDQKTIISWVDPVMEAALKALEK